MKKIIFTLLCMITLMAAPAQAQVKFGVSGGISMNKVSLKGTEIGKNYTGWYLGPTVEVGLPITGIKIDGSIQYAYNGAKLSQNGIDQNINSSYISVPLNAKFNFGISSLASIFLSAGPQFDWLVGTKEHKLFDAQNYTMRSSQVSINLGGGVRVFDQFQIGLSYNISCGDATDKALTMVGKAFKNNTWKLGLLVFF
ncbi:MAG: porin family protein [Bacteroidaceae bacterium]|nr:porin family protein [Candidatus Minthousia equi]MCQ2246926.1 porin family protein [Bacteroidaceae bacterium]